MCALATLCVVESQNIRFVLDECVYLQGHNNGILPY